MRAPGLAALLWLAVLVPAPRGQERDASQDPVEVRGGESLLDTLPDADPPSGGRGAQAGDPGDPDAARPRLAPTGRTAAHLRITGPLDTGALGHLQRVIRTSRGVHDAIVLELDTPGGSVPLMWQLARMIDAAAEEGFHTAAWVNDRAVSAGALLALSCETIAMRPSATIGSALPVTISPTGELQPTAADPAVVEKQLSAFRAEFRAWAEDHGRPAILAEAMVDPRVRVYEVDHDGVRKIVSGVEWDDLRARNEPVSLLRTIVDDETLLNVSAREAVELGLADGEADDLGKVLELARLPGADAVLYERTRSEDLASFLASIRFLLLVVALVAIYAELKMPGFGVPGILGIAALALLLFGQYLVGLADVLHVVAVAAGIVLIAVEIFFLPGGMWAGLLGGLLVLGGLVFASLGPSADFEYALDRQLAVDAALNLMLGLAVGVVAAALLGRFLPNAPVLRRLVLAPPAVGDAHGAAMPAGVGRAAEVAQPGAKGRALTDLRPVGKVQLDAAPDRDWEARAPGDPLERGDRVVVVEVRGGRLVVEPFREGTA